mmetsp:Transcript_35611/g.65986  ORF Transcript_35611/g.65986 Transcript_35611/m.65986 type:complete len:266 (-) Transcript_35611:610-1407(-)
MRSFRRTTARAFAASSMAILRSQVSFPMLVGSALILHQSPKSYAQIVSSANGEEDPMSKMLRELPDMYDNAFESFNPSWQQIVATMKSLEDLPSEIHVLDLAFGPGEPGCLIAQEFPESQIILSDLEDKMLKKAEMRAKNLGLESRVSVQSIDMTKLTSHVPRNSQDVVTCSFGLFFVPDGMDEIYSVLKPGGYLVATVWDDLPHIELATKCLDMILEETSKLPIDGTYLGNGLADHLLTDAGFQLVEHKHSEVSHAIHCTPWHY